MNRTRIVHFRIEPVLVVDDGEELLPGPQLEPATVTLSQLGDYITRLRDFIGQLDAREPATSERGPSVKA